MLTGIVDENGRYDVTVFEIGRIGRGKRLGRMWSSVRQFVDMLRLWIGSSKLDLEKARPGPHMCDQLDIGKSCDVSIVLNSFAAGRWTAGGSKILLLLLKQKCLCPSLTRGSNICCTCSDAPLSSRRVSVCACA
jgi:hypothetical protein